MAPAWCREDASGGMRLSTVGGTSWTQGKRAPPLLGSEETNLISNCLFLGLPSKRLVFWKYQLFKCESLEIISGKVQKSTPIHDGEMALPTHLPLSLGVRNMGSVAASYGGQSKVKQSQSSSFPTTPSTSNLERLESSQKCQTSTMSCALGAGVSLCQASSAPSLSSQRWGE